MESTKNKRRLFHFFVNIGTSGKYTVTLSVILAALISLEMFVPGVSHFSYGFQVLMTEFDNAGKIIDEFIYNNR